MDGSYSFTGDYLRELQPSGTQYLFDWKFSPSTNGQVVWNGITGWAGGHIWQVTITNLTLVPQAWLNISPVGAASVQVTWATNFADYVLECAGGLLTAGWSSVTNAASSVVGDRISVTLDTGDSPQFYRLRKP